MEGAIVLWERTHIVAREDRVKFDYAVGIGELDSTIEMVSTMKNASLNPIRAVLTVDRLSCSRLKHSCHWY